MGIMRVVRRAARAIIIDDDGRLVVFKRTVPKRRVYWSTPGGGVDPEDSSIEAALHRELAEELGAVVDRTQQVFLASPPRGDGIAIQHFFVCHLVSMNLSARTGAEFSNPAKGRYDVERIDLRGKKLARYDLQPRQARDFILANRQALLAAALDDDTPPLNDPVPSPAAAAATTPATARTSATSTAESAANLATSADVAKPGTSRKAVVAEAEIPTAEPAVARAESALTVGAGSDAALAIDLAELATTVTGEALVGAVMASEVDVPTGGRDTAASGTSGGTSSGQSHPALDAAPAVSDGAQTASGDGAPTAVPGDAAMAGAGAGSGARRVVRIVEQRKAPRGPGRPASQPPDLVTTPTGSSSAGGGSAQTTAVQEPPRQPQRRTFFRRRRR